MVHAAGFENIVFFTVIKQIRVLEGQVVELEIAGKAHQTANQLADQVTNSAALCQGARQPGQRLQKAER